MRILNFGSLNIDKVYRVSRFVRAGETMESLSYNSFPGGKGLNQSIAIARAGSNVYHAGTIGKDGLFLKEVLRENRVDVSYIKEDGEVTGHALIQVSEEGENCIILFKGSNYENNREYMDEVFSHFEEGDILVLQNEVNDLDYLLNCGKKKGMRILLNPSPINPHLKKLDLSGVTWLMLNETEGEELTEEKVPEKIAERLHEKYQTMQIILTLGKAGAIYYDGRKMIHQNCFPTECIDTTAAGDTFTGYFISLLESGRTVEEALQFASCAAAIAVSRKGASTSIPYYEEVESRLRILMK